MTEPERKAEQVLLSIPTDGDGFGDFMSLFPALAAEQDDHSEFTRRTGPPHAETWFPPGRTNILGGEFGWRDEMVGAVARRSQLEFAYEACRGTAAESVSDSEREEAADVLMGRRAVDLGIRDSADELLVGLVVDRVDIISFPL